MRQGSNPKRSRGKGGNRGSNGSRNPLNRSFESNGPGGKVRGNPHQVYEKYLAMARDYQADDPIMAENLLQHADHYFRVILDASGGKSKREENRRSDGEDKSESAGNADGDGRDKSANQEASSGDGAAEAGNAEESEQAAEAAAAADSEDSTGDQGEASKRPRRGRRSKSGDDSETKATASDAA